MWTQVAHCGGISELHRLASYTVETYDVALAPHCPLGSIALAACMQVDVAAPSCKSSLPLAWSLQVRVGYRGRPREDDILIDVCVAR